GKFVSEDSIWDVVIAEIGMGGTTTSFEVERAIAHYDPVLVLFVGVAGGLKDVKLGDVVAATKVYGYEAGKVGVSFETRPDVGNTTYRMEQRARATAKKQHW